MVIAFNQGDSGRFLDVYLDGRKVKRWVLADDGDEGFVVVRDGMHMEKGPYQYEPRFIIKRGEVRFVSKYPQDFRLRRIAS